MHRDLTVTSECCSGLLLTWSAMRDVLGHPLRSWGCGQVILEVARGCRFCAILRMFLLSFQDFYNLYRVETLFTIDVMSLFRDVYHQQGKQNTHLFILIGEDNSQPVAQFNFSSNQLEVLQTMATIFL